MNIYFFQWPSELGGADTRLKDLIKLFGSKKQFKVKVIPNDDSRLKEQENVDFILKNNGQCLSWNNLDKKLEGVAISCCNFRLFADEWRLKRIKDSGLKFIWMNDMTVRMAEKELEALTKKLIDVNLYTTKFHKSQLDMEDKKLNLVFRNKFYFIPNYFDSNSYKYFEREKKDTFTIGKHSRPDWRKFSNDFPAFYENLNLKNPRFKVMGVGKDFSTRFSWYNFDPRWSILPPNEEKTQDFLNSLDLYIYNSHNSFIENQSRAIVEAGLCGLPIIAPNKYYFPEQILHGETGFVYESYDDCKKYAQELENNFKLRLEFGKKSHSYLKDIYCDANKQLKLWERVFSEIYF